MSDGGVSNQPGLWGGKISSTQVKLNITQEMNGVKIACQGTNEALQRSINEAIELQVLCKCYCSSVGIKSFADRIGTLILKSSRLS